MMENQKLKEELEKELKHPDEETAVYQRRLKAVEAVIQVLQAQLPVNLETEAPGLERTKLIIMPRR